MVCSWIVKFHGCLIAGDKFAEQLLSLQSTQMVEEVQAHPHLCQVRLWGSVRRLFHHSLLEAFNQEMLNGTLSLTSTMKTRRQQLC